MTASKQISQDVIVRAQSLIHCEEYATKEESASDLCPFWKKCISQAAKKVLLRVGRKAFQILGEVSSFTELLDLQAVVRNGVAERAGPLPNNSIESLEERATEVLLQLASDEMHPLHRLLEIHLALACLEHAMRQEQVNNRLEIFPDSLRQHFAIMRAAHTGSSASEQTKCLLEVLREKKRCFSRIPSLLLVHDFDNCLTLSDREYYSEIPLFSFKDKLANILDRGSLARGRQRMSLVYGLLEHPELTTIAHRQVKSSVAHIRYFDDALQTLCVGRQNGVKHLVLSANVAIFVEEAISQLHIPDVNVVALQSHSFRGAEKPLMILELVVENPESIILLIDDADWRLTKAVREGTLSLNLQRPIPLNECAFLCARGDGQEDDGLFPFQHALSQNGLLHGRNIRKKRDEVYTDGYQATLEFVRTFVNWRTGQF